MTSESVTRETGPDRYEITVDGESAGFARFIDDGDRRVFFHTEIGDEYGGRGLAKKLVQQALESSRSDGKRIVPVCPFVAKFVSNSDEFADLVDKPTPATLALVPKSSD